tara:strand:+ start:3875 stop:5212 length:1338 start_codon:yes stop_codon:yes gene_type:complete
MKYKYLTLILFFPFSVFSQILWDNFEDTRIGYYEFVHGGMTTRFENPNPASQVNNSSLCAQYVRNPGETYDVIVIVANGPFSDLTDYLNGSKKMTVDVFSPAVGIPLQITLEDSAIAGATNYPDGRHSIYTATTSVANEWETIEFTFDSRPDNTVPDANVTSLILLFDIGNNTNDTYYFDNLYGPEFNNQCDAVIVDPSVNFADWDCNWNLRICPSATPCASYDYISGWLNQTYNPDPSTINSSKYAAEYTRNPDQMGEDVLIAYFSNGSLDLSVNKYFNFKLYGPPRPIYVSFQDAGSNEIYAFNSVLSSNNQWQQFTVDLSSVSNQNIDRFVLFLDQSVVNWDTYYLDDFHLSDIPLETQYLEFSDNIKIFPQPAKNVVNISSVNSISSVSVLDITGKSISNTSFSKNKNNVTIDISFLDAGVYLVSVVLNDKVITKKIKVLN